MQPESGVCGERVRASERASERASKERAVAEKVRKREMYAGIEARGWSGQQRTREEKGVEPAQGKGG